MWFHDHTLGTTRLNVYAGLAGFYFLKDPALEPKKYPSGPYEIEMAVQDRLFDRKSQLYFPQQQKVKDHPFWSVIFEGDVATVNGVGLPYLKVEPRRYRFHLLNGSNHREFIFTFGDAPVIPYRGPMTTTLISRSKFPRVPVSPGERADVIVDFTNFVGKNILLTNSGPFMIHNLRQVMQFRVSREFCA